MTETFSILAQLAAPAATLINLYTVPAATQAVISSLVVCNRGNTNTRFRISIAPAGAADANSQYIYYNVFIPDRDTFVATIGVTLKAADVIRVYADNANVTFSAFGVEIT